MTTMKKLCLLAIAVGLLGLVAAPAAFAKKGAAAPTTVPSDTYAKYDTNYSGVLDADEKTALLKDFDADKTGPLKALDANNDGKLSDDEIAAIPATKAADAPVKKAKKKK
jgi:hypothetical protein